MAFPFAHRKRITERCSLRNAFISNVAMFDVYTCHGGVIAIKFAGGSQY